ncbi:reverse transcriptase domain-containing protein [Tanacetum coccineum]
MLLDFDDYHDTSDDEIQDNGKGKAKVDEEDLSKPFKEVLKCPFTRIIVEFSSPGHRMPANVKIYDGTGDLEDHVGRFVGIGNQGEWPMPVWCRMFQQTLDGKARAWFDKLPSGSIDNWGSLQEKFLNRFGMLKACDKDPTEISKITRKANETLPHFKERWVSESNAIPNVPELMQISSFMSSHKCPELAKRFSDSIPKTVDEMLKRVDDYLRSEEAYRSTELPRGEFQRRDAPVQWVQRNDRSQRFSHGNNRRRSEHKFVARMPERHIPIPTRDTSDRTPTTPTPASTASGSAQQGKRKFGKLNHLIKDVRQRGKEGQQNNGPQGKGINIIRVNSSDRKRKTTMTDEGWMNVRIIFPPILARDLSEKPLVVEAESKASQDSNHNVWIFREASQTVRKNQTRCMLWGEQEMPKSNYEVRNHPSTFTLQQHLRMSRLKGGSPNSGAVPYTIHGMMKFPTPWGVATVISQTPVVFECRKKGKKQAVEPPKEEKAQDTTNPTDYVLVNPAYSEQLVAIGTSLSPEGANQLRILLKKNIDIFAWEPSDMTGEVAEWLKAGIVRPVKYPTWISNPVLVKRADGSWRMCIDFKNINAACPKDYYPLPEIDSKIEAVMGFTLKCFLDAYKGYHQVQMAEEDEEKTAFYTDQGTYCYTKMPFGLKNAGATYQRLVDRAF